MHRFHPIGTFTHIMHMDNMKPLSIILSYMYTRAQSCSTFVHVRQWLGDYILYHIIVFLDPVYISWRRHRTFQALSSLVLLMHCGTAGP